MNIGFLKIKGTWQDIKNSAMTTVGKDAGENPSAEWKRRMLLCEHSPIRQLFIKWKWVNIKSWVSVHFVRHKYGIEHWVKSQRPDRTGNRSNRDDATQGTLIDHEAEANAQAIINISRRRLCNMAMPETRNAWIAMLFELNKYEPELASICVPDCIYRGHCFEYRSCGWFRTPQYKILLDKYREGIN